MSLDGLDVPIPADVRWCRGTLAGLVFHVRAVEAERLQAHIVRRLRLLGTGLPLEVGAKVGC
ncbi:hypothetical protein [Rhodospira trueperi]|uniref:hypothetical protein n=1 Tax=Rhodospira trueperi TaxID=69960 RepID=UPI000B8A5264|nr:hypothetical protein [Rhodospira trueperi]